MSDDGLKQWLEEVFAPLGQVRTRRMFGGNGVTIDGLNMGFFGDGEIYLKTDAQTKAQFVAAALVPFVYTLQSKPVEMSYYAAPPDFYDDADVALAWGRLAYDAARRAAAKKKPKTSKSKG
jgi:DNA transformation protein and related proteins